MSAAPTEPPDDQVNARCLQRFRSRVRDELRAGSVRAIDAANLLLLSQYARPEDGTLRGWYGTYYHEEQLATFMGWSVKTFYSHWKRWYDEGWVEPERRPSNRGVMARRLCPERPERTGSI